MSLSPRDLVCRSAGETLGAVTRYAGRLQPQGSFVFAIHLYQDYRGSRHVHDKHESRAAAARVNVERDLVP